MHLALTSLLFSNFTSCQYSILFVLTFTLLQDVNAKAIYSLCKILNLGQKLKFQKTCQKPFYKSFEVVLCKKPLEKTVNIREMRPF